MSDTEPKKSETTSPEASSEVPEKQKPADLIMRLREALDAKEGEDSLHNLGNLFYETYGTKEHESGKSYLQQLYKTFSNL